MNVADVTARVGPLAQSVLEDEQFKLRLRPASSAGRDAARTARGKKTKEPTRLAALTRAGDALREAGKAISALGDGAEERRQKQKRRIFAPLAVAGTGAAAAAALWSQRGSPDHSQPTTKENTYG